MFFCGTESEWGDDFSVGTYWDGELINKLRSNMAGIMGQTTYPFLMSQNQWFKKENTRVYVQGEMGEKQKDGTFHGDAHYDRSPGKDLNWVPQGFVNTHHEAVYKRCGAGARTLLSGFAQMAAKHPDIMKK